MSNENLSTAISQANDKLETPATEEVKEEVKQEEKQEEKAEEKPPAKPEDEEATQALSLFRALKDPEKAATIIRIMAQEAGVLQTKEEKQEVVQTIEDIVKEGLGEDYEFLAEKLAPIIKKAVELETKDVRDRTEKTEREREAEKIDSSIKSVMDKYEDSSKLEDDVLKLMNDILPAPNQPVEVYFERLLKIAAAEKGVALRTKSAGQKIIQNRENAAARLAAEGGKSANAVTSSATTMNLQDAINSALEQLKEKS